jgi:hypothetical protein
MYLYTHMHMMISFIGVVVGVVVKILGTRIATICSWFSKGFRLGILTFMHIFNVYTF